mmetsp:Transcript_24014/g.56886  ORF Transcript_24014/g.56886 Transcript_24014/m.56886 type:complete len:341 (-) Transcript_24014:1318-2340(-)
MVETCGTFRGGDILADLVGHLAGSRVQGAELGQRVLLWAVLGLDNEPASTAPGCLHRLDVELCQWRHHRAGQRGRQRHIHEMPQIDHHIHLCVQGAAGHLQRHQAVPGKVPGLQGAVHCKGRPPRCLWGRALGGGLGSQPAGVLCRGQQHSQRVHLVQPGEHQLPKSQLGAQRDRQCRHVGQAILKDGGVVRQQAVHKVVDVASEDTAQHRRPVAIELGELVAHLLRGQRRVQALPRLQLLLQRLVQRLPKVVGAGEALDGPRQERLVDLVEEAHRVVQQTRQGGLQGPLGLCHEAQRRRKALELHLQRFQGRGLLQHAGETLLGCDRHLRQGPLAWPLS